MRVLEIAIMEAISLHMIFEAGPAVHAEHWCILGLMAEGLVPVFIIFQSPFVLNILIFDHAHIVLPNSFFILGVFLGGSSFAW